MKQLLVPRFHGHQIMLPEGWPKPKGYSNGMLARGRLLFLGGQIGWNEKGVLADGMVAQIRQTLRNIAGLLAEADSGPEALVRLTWFISDMEAYSRNLREIGGAYRAVLGHFYPPMTLVQVVRLVEPQALVEIEATAVIPD